MIGKQLKEVRVKLAADGLIEAIYFMTADGCYDASGEKASLSRDSVKYLTPIIGAEITDFRSEFYDIILETTKGYCRFTKDGTGYVTKDHLPLFRALSSENVIYQEQPFEKQLLFRGDAPGDFQFGFIVSARLDFLTSKSGIPIYEGDVVNMHYKDGRTELATIVYDYDLQDYTFKTSEKKWMFRDIEYALSHVSFACSFYEMQFNGMMLQLYSYNELMQIMARLEQYHAVSLGVYSTLSLFTEDFVELHEYFLQTPPSVYKKTTFEKIKMVWAKDEFLLNDEVPNVIFLFPKA